MNTQVKVGDTIKIIGGGEGGTQFANGSTTTVKCVDGRRVYVRDNYIHGRSGSGCSCGKHSWVLEPTGYELVKSGKKGKADKPKPVNFLLKYDLDTDPVEEYATLKEVKARIADLVKNEKTNRFKRDSIVVYEIKKVTRVKVETSVSIKGI